MNTCACSGDYITFNKHNVFVCDWNSNSLKLSVRYGHNCHSINFGALRSPQRPDIFVWLSVDLPSTGNSINHHRPRPRQCVLEGGGLFGSCGERTQKNNGKSIRIFLRLFIIFAKLFGVVRGDVFKFVSQNFQSRRQIPHFTAKLNVKIHW